MRTYSMAGLIRKAAGMWEKWKISGNNIEPCLFRKLLSIKSGLVSNRQKSCTVSYTHLDVYKRQVLLFVLLSCKVLKVEHIREKSDFLLANMAFFFVPAGVSIINYFDVLKSTAWKLLFICLITTILTFAATAGSIKLTLKLMRKKKGGEWNGWTDVFSLFRHCIECPGFFHRGMDPEENGACGMQSSDSVSYTHLDVYKRQVQADITV